MNLEINNRYIVSEFSIEEYTMEERTKFIITNNTKDILEMGVLTFDFHQGESKILMESGFTLQADETFEFHVFNANTKNPCYRLCFDKLKQSETDMEIRNTIFEFALLRNVLFPMKPQTTQRFVISEISS